MAFVLKQVSVFLDPIGDGAKSQWTVFGAATAWQALSKPSTRPPNGVSSTSSGIRSTTNNNNTTLQFGTLAGKVPADAPYLNFLRIWVNVNGTVQPNQRVDTSITAGGT